MMAGVCLVAMVVAAVAVLVGSYVAAQRQTADAADLAALSGAAAYTAGTDPCGAARRIATANRTTLVACKLTGDTLDFVVSVTVERQLNWPAALPRTITGKAHAGHLEPMNS